MCTFETEGEEWREMLVLTGKKSEEQKEFTVGACKLDNAYSFLCKVAHQDICIKSPAF